MQRPDLEVRLTPTALEVLRRRYLAKDEAGRPVETPEELFWRVALSVARAEADPGPVAESFYRSMASLEFLPNSPALMNAGRELGQYFACFVLPVADTLVSPDEDGIFDAIRAAALIHKTGGGTGFDFSRLRPAGSSVASTHGHTSGPVSFMRVFNAATEAIHQGGFRRGANMGILRIDHPDILSFIDLKRDPREMTNFNLSVAVPDAFLESLRRDGPHHVADPRSASPVPLRDASGTAWSARRIWDHIARRAWETGEPGLVFIDRINAANPTPSMGAMEATNPCGEMPLLPFEACNLGSINLGRFVGTGGVDWPRLAATVRLAVRFLDDVIDVNRYPMARIESVVRANRKIGLGVMGWADLLIRLGLRYDSAEALELAERTAKFLREEGWKASMDLARERGPFPAYAASRFVMDPGNPGFAECWKASPAPMRNATVTTVAPTGTLSILAGASAGIEPLFALSYTRTILEGTEIPEVHPPVAELAAREGFDPAAPPPKWRDVLVTAHEIAPEGHLRMQAAFQRHTDNAVSKTVNFPEAASPEDVRRVFDLAVDLGVKGVTVYRDGSRAAQPIAPRRDIQCLDC